MIPWTWHSGKGEKKTGKVIGQSVKLGVWKRYKEYFKGNGNILSLVAI